jgi:hypothetical protein
MGYHPRIESPSLVNFLTSRTRNSELWFANNPALEEFTLGLLAKVCHRYRVKLYASAIEGSHIHNLALFPGSNRRDFCRDLNSGIAVAVKRLTPNYFSTGGFFERRYSNEFVGDDSDIERQFFYTVLQPVKDGLVNRLSEYPFYNCYHDAACGIERTYKVTDWARYNDARRYNKRVRLVDYQVEHTLRYERLPGYEHLSKKEYKVIMDRKLEAYRQEIIAQRIKEGKTAVVGREELLKTIPGTRARNPKRSSRYSHRPRVLAQCHKLRAELRNWYFNQYFAYQEASRRFRAGEVDVEFPPFTIRPPTWPTVRPTGPYSPL